MFDLHCSEFELFCSDPRIDRRIEGWAFKSSVTPLAAGMDLNRRPLGYEFA